MFNIFIKRILYFCVIKGDFLLRQMMAVWGSAPMQTEKHKPDFMPEQQ